MSLAITALRARGRGSPAGHRFDCGGTDHYGGCAGEIAKLADAIAWCDALLAGELSPYDPWPVA